MEVKHTLSNGLHDFGWIYATVFDNGVLAEIRARIFAEQAVIKPASRFTIALLVQVVSHVVQFTIVSCK